VVEGVKGGRNKKEVSGCFGWQGKKKVPDGGGVLRWSEGVREFRGGFDGMVRGGRTVLGVGGGGGVGVGMWIGGVGREVRGMFGLTFFKLKL